MSDWVWESVGLKKYGEVVKFKERFWDVALVGLEIGRFEDSRRFGAFGRS